MTATLPASNALLIATTNSGKIEEFNAMSRNFGLSFLSLTDVGINMEVRETGTTFEENAILKAEAYGETSKLVTVADDSGLEVTALGGKPGVLSARYAGLGATDAANIDLLLERLKDVPEDLRTARFRCVIALKAPHEPPKLYTGVCKGRITRIPRGEHGFGYDPVFFIPQIGKTMAELTPDEKNSISHRGHAVRGLAKELASSCE